MSTHSLWSCLELFWCKKRQKSPGQEDLGNMGLLKVLNNTKLILNDSRGHSCSFRTKLVLFRTFRRPLFPKPVSCPGLFLPFLTALLLYCLLGIYNFEKKVLWFWFMDKSCTRVKQIFLQSPGMPTLFIWWKLEDQNIHQWTGCNPQRAFLFLNYLLEYHFLLIK